MDFGQPNRNMLTEILHLCYFFLVIFSKYYLLNFLDHFVSQLLIELESSSKKQKNPHSQLVWGGDTLQSSIYHSFHLKSDHKIFPIPLSS